MYRYSGPWFVVDRIQNRALQSECSERLAQRACDTLNEHERKHGRLDEGAEPIYHVVFEWKGARF